jgi:hypothetical protein
MPLLLVILPLQTCGKPFDSVVFGGARVHEVEVQDLRFPLIVFWGVRFELEVVYEASHILLKFCLNPFGESGDGLMGS